MLSYTWVKRSATHQATEYVVVVAAAQVDVVHMGDDHLFGETRFAIQNDALHRPAGGHRGQLEDTQATRRSAGGHTEVSWRTHGGQLEDMRRSAGGHTQVQFSSMYFGNIKRSN